MASLKFYLDHPYDTVAGKKKLKKSRCKVYLFVTFTRDQRIRIKTEMTILPEQWDFSSGKMKAGKYGTIEFNRELNNIESQATQVLINNGRSSFETIKTEMLAEFGKIKAKPKSFFEILDLFIETRRPKLDPKTIKKFDRLKDLLMEFQRYKRMKITFETIDLTFYDLFCNYLYTVPKNRRGTKGFLDDTVGKYIENLKAFMNWCWDRGYHTNLVFKKFKTKRNTRVDNPVLTLEELRTLYKHDFSEDPRLDLARDLFCFMCFTGQRVSDALNFKKEDLHGNEWRFTQLKNDSGKPIEVRIPLVGWISPALDILKKYDYKLPEISEQRLNDYIKEAAEAAKITAPVTKIRTAGKDRIKKSGEKHKFISTHMARRTAVTLLLQMGMPIDQVMKITGHQKIETVMKYVNTVDKAVTSELERIGKLGYTSLRKVT